MKREANEKPPVESTGHEWDGIVELDNPLPRWWLWVFYASIAFAVGYWILMPAWPGVSGYTKGLLGHSDRVQVSRELAKLDALRGVEMARLREASLEQIEADPILQDYALMVGQSVFGDNCATCHGLGGTGSKGYANLRDDVWLWGGGLSDIHQTITVGVRSGPANTRMSRMPAFGRDGLLNASQIADLTEYVLALSRQKADGEAVARAAPLFAQHCVSCHTATGVGDQTKGAPNLTDREWLFGSDRASIHAQIVTGKAGVMPAWGERLKPETIKALAVYVHANAAEKAR